MAGAIEVLVPGGKANPDPPLGPELGPTPIDMQGVVDDISGQTTVFNGMGVSVAIEYNDDGSFSIEVDVPPTAALIKGEVGFDTGSGEPQEDFVADVSIGQLKKIAGQKLSDLLSYNLKNASGEVAETCASLGITIEGEGARTLRQRIDGGDFDDYFDDE